MLEKPIKYFTKKPSTIFLIDSIGAFTTASFLFVILQQFDAYFGIPKTQMSYLLAIALCFCIYSATCFVFLKRRFTRFMRIIGVANIVYCALTIGILIKFWDLISLTGTIYFLIEIVIISVLSYVELNVARSIERNKN